MNDDDPFLWLEEVTGERALDWVRARNAESARVLEAVPGFAEDRDVIRKILDDRAQIPYVSRRGAHLYNFWRDGSNPRGLWRRTSLDDYRKPQPSWDVLLDLDRLARDERENWVWSGAQCLGPQVRRCLISLSRGGADATVVREFDLESRRFVDGGFALAEAKTRIAWVDADTVAVASDFGPGSLTASGYPRIVKLWRRGTSLEQAPTIFEAQPSDVSAWVQVDRTPGFERIFVSRSTDFFNSELFLWSRKGGLARIDKPSDAQLFVKRDWAFLQLRSALRAPQREFAPGSLLAVPLASLLAGAAPQDRRFDLVFEPTSTRALARGGVGFTRTRVLLSILDNVSGRIEEVTQDSSGRWTQRRPVDAPQPGTLSFTSLAEDESGDADPLAESYLVNYADFLTPDSLLLMVAGSDRKPEVLKRRPSYFDAEGMRVEQRFARSKDGTRVPYFIVWPKGAKADGRNPTLLYGYGGFQVSQQPWYSGVWGATWYARGGVFVVANIRGGGEFGPSWHRAAIRADKQRSYDDFAAVAEDLIATKVTRPSQLGIYGGSNGGLLVGAVMLQRPELFGAVVSSVPLLDMRRYHLLLAGASWMAEYGDPDKPQDWAFIRSYSPYQNVRADAKYPALLLTTSTRDDRVHPAHARKMAARMLQQGHEVLYFENIEGGHGGAADNAQRARLTALQQAFLRKTLFAPMPAGALQPAR